MITLGLSDDHLLDCGLSDGMVIRSVQIDGILPRGLLILTLGLAFNDLGKGTYAGEICEVTLSVTGSWDEASSYVSWTGVSSGTGLVLYGLIGSKTVIVGLKIGRAHV